MDEILHTHFTEPLLAWFSLYGRKDLPWQHPRTPYRVWVSEIMLQQTRVQSVIPYFLKFMQSFPEIFSLARAEEDTVFAHWAGLGYYSRARNLHATAKIIAHTYQGIFPEEAEALQALPGIGASTAAAILSQAFMKPYPILDANVKRVLSRFFMIDGLPSKKPIEQRLWQLAHACMSQQSPCDYTQAIMDLGAICCTPTNPGCVRCPLKNHCLAFLEGKVANYPTKKISKALPTKQQQFLLFYTGNHKQNLQIYLEKRPPSGIWGGLWCLPSIDDSLQIAEWAEQQCGFLCETIESMEKIKHSFSHFHLHLLPFCIHVQQDLNILRENTGKWFRKEELANIGLAKPIATIIDNFITPKG